MNAFGSDPESAPGPDAVPGAPYAPLLRSQRDVEDVWRALVRPLGWASRSLWFLLIDAGDRPMPILNEVKDLPDELDREDAATAVALWRTVLDEVAPAGRVAALLCRPGRGGPTAADRASASVLYQAGRAGGVPLEVVHLATDEQFWPMPADAVGSLS